MKRLLGTGLALTMVFGLLAGYAGVGVEEAEGPKKVWLCHFEDNNHEAMEPYGDDRNGSNPGFWTVKDAGEYLTGDYVVRYNATMYPGVPAGLNPGQVALCEGNYGEFILVSVNAVGTEEEVRGHRAQLVSRNVPGDYPDGWKG